MILVPSLLKTLPLDPVPTPQGLGPVSKTCQSTRIPPKMPRRSMGNHWVGSRLLAPNKKLQLQTLHQGPKKGSKSFDPKGMLITSSFFCYSLLIHELPCRVPQDIPSTSPAKNIPTEGESLNEVQRLRISRALKTSMSLLALLVIRPPHLLPTRVMMPLIHFPCQTPQFIKMHPQ
jgi:hypothetical protein